MKIDSWQFETLDRLKDLLHSFETVPAAILVGSMAYEGTQPDYWSDIDLVVVIEDEALEQFYPGTDWLQPINPIYTTSHSESPHRFTSRICFVDMRRLDLVFIPSSAFDVINRWDYNPFEMGYHILFSKSKKIEKVISGGIPNTPAVNDREAQVLAITNGFWFKGMLAVYKVVRNDLLIALHLSLDLMRDCLVLKMILRDRAEGTTHHRIGGVGNEFVALMDMQPLDFSATGILNIIDHSSQILDDLAKEWFTDYSAKRYPLHDWIEYAKYSLENVDTHRS